METIIHYAKDGEDNDQLVVSIAEINQEPFPTFDIEINKEDKDKDIENPAVHKDPEKDNSELESPDPDKK